MPCTGKKDERLRRQLKGEIAGVVTVVELLALVKDRQIDINGQGNTAYDPPYAECSGGSY